MKRVIVVTVVAVLLLCFATPILADDPPGMEVDIGVSTPGDVDLNVDINAEGNVDVTIDGVDLQQTAGLAQEAYNKANEPKNFLWDYSYYWQLSGIGPMVEGQLNQLNGLTNLLINAQAKLIQGQLLTGDEVGAISREIEDAKASNAASIAEINILMQKLQVQDEITWNQLMYGAEYHLGLLDNRVTEQEQTIVNLQAKTDLLQTQLEIINTNHTNLWNYTNYLQRQYLYYFWVIAGCGLIITALLVLVLIQRRK